MYSVGYSVRYSPGTVPVWLRPRLAAFAFNAHIDGYFCVQQTFRLLKITFDRVSMRNGTNQCPLSLASAATSNRLLATVQLYSNNTGCTWPICYCCYYYYMYRTVDVCTKGASEINLRPYQHLNCHDAMPVFFLFSLVGAVSAHN